MTDPDSEHLFWVPRKKYGKAQARCNKTTIKTEYLPIEGHQPFKALKQQNPLHKNLSAKDFCSYSTKDSDEMSFETLDDQNSPKVQYRPPYLDDESFKQFTQDKDPEPLSLKPEWNPVTELSSEISKTPPQELESWQKEHTELFYSGFHKQNCQRLLSNIKPEIRKEIETDIIRDFCKETLKIMSTECQSLQAQFPDITCRCCCGYLPEEGVGDPAPPLNEKIIVQVITHAKKNQLYPAIVIVPTDYSMAADDEALLEESLETIRKRWSGYQEFFGLVTNFKKTIFMKYDRDEKKYYKWQHIVNFNECLLQKKSPEKLEDFFKVWYAMALKAEQNYSEYISLK